MIIIFKKVSNTITEFDDENRMELTPDAEWGGGFRPWDDFGYKTTFNNKLFLEGKEYDLPQMKILISEEIDTHSFFKELLEQTDSEFCIFPLNNSYISLPTDIEFYETLKSLLPDKIIDKILYDLSDACLIKNTDKLNERKYLLENKKENGFNTSLLRDMTSKKAFANGWEILNNVSSKKDVLFKIYFNLENYSNTHEVEINLKKSIFPHNLNVLIGSNGTGKSQTLSYLIDELLAIGKTQQLEQIPVFNQIVTIAYSPFETFRISLDETPLKIKSSYKYFGFRNNKKIFDLQQPNIDSSKSILNILKEDEEKEYLINRKNKFNTFMSIIKKAITFDYIAFEMKEEDYNGHVEEHIIDNMYLTPINDDLFSMYIDDYKEKVLLEKGILFFKNDKLLPLSSGQQIFVQLISNIISSIRQDTIILIDEPELYLHPNLEVELINLLKELLILYNSYAIIATHSAVIAREVSKDYIQILRKVDNDEIDISRPPFETIGSNLERLNSYVFFDKDIAKPYQKWLQKLTNKHKSGKKVVEKYSDVLNEESLILLYGMEPNNAN